MLQSSTMSRGPQLLRSWMRRSKTTQAELARLADMQESSISRALRGERGLDLVSAVRLQRVTEIPPEAWSGAHGVARHVGILGRVK